MRLDMLRGRRIDLNLTRSRSVNFKVRGKRGRDRDEDQDVPEGLHGGSRVLVGERGRVSAWSDSGDEVNIRSSSSSFLTSATVLALYAMARVDHIFTSCCSVIIIIITIIIIVTLFVCRPNKTNKFMNNTIRYDTMR